jgi:hypothetical protein
MHQKTEEALSEQPERWRLTLPETASAGIGSEKFARNESAATDQYHFF